jgi:hypothetical protein
VCVLLQPFARAPRTAAGPPSSLAVASCESKGQFGRLLRWNPCEC